MSEKLVISRPEEVVKEEIIKKSKKWIWLLVTGIVLVAVVLSTLFGLLNINNSKIVFGVKINNVDFSGLTADEARVKISKLVEEKLSEEITLEYYELSEKSSLEQFGFKYNTEDALQKAQNVAKDSNLLVNNFRIIKSYLFKENISVDITLDEEVFIGKVNDLNSKIKGGIVENAYYVEGNELIITRGTAGLGIVKEDLKKAIIENAKVLIKQDKVINLPVKRLEPGEIDIEKIHNEIYTKAKDAYIEKNPFKMFAQVNGVDFAISMEEAKEKLKENKNEYVIPLVITVPKITTDQLGDEAFPNLLATYSTNYNSSSFNRKTNVQLATKRINGTVIMPGETFSYNKTVGKRTIEAGFKEAAAYAGGVSVPSVGGGICQVSSTLYNAVLLSNLEVIERSNHSLPVSYVPVSRDATVNWGTTDFKFKNNRKNPVKIVTEANGTTCKISIFGEKEEDDFEVEIESYKTETVGFKTKYVDDITLEVGTEKIKEKGSNGYKSVAYKILKKNGTQVSKELLSKDTYGGHLQIVLRGTKPVNEVVLPPVSVPEETTQPEVVEQVEQPPQEETSEEVLNQSTEGQEDEPVESLPVENQDS